MTRHLVTLLATTVLALGSVHCSGADAQTVYRLSFPLERTFTCTQGPLSDVAAASVSEAFSNVEYASLVRTGPSDYALDVGGTAYTGSKAGDTYALTGTTVTQPYKASYTSKATISLTTVAERASGTVDIEVTSTCVGAGCVSNVCRQSIRFEGIEVETAP